MMVELSDLVLVAFVGLLVWVLAPKARTWWRSYKASATADDKRRRAASEGLKKDEVMDLIKTSLQTAGAVFGPQPQPQQQPKPQAPQLDVEGLRLQLREAKGKNKKEMQKVLERVMQQLQ